MDKNVYFTIFSGRQKYLSILKKYLDKLLEKQLIKEVHLWVYTTNNDDVNYMNTISKNDDRYKLLIPKNPNKKWGYYYNYYYNMYTNENDVIIKCDDDIVYIDINKFENFIQNMNPTCINFPNIVNNDVCAYYQQQCNIHSLFTYDVRNKINEVGVPHPLTNWYTDFNKAYEIHELFLSNPDRFKVDYKYFYGSRISINFFAISGNAVKEYFKYLNVHEIDDEHIIGRLPKILNKHQIDMNFVVSHFQFGPQSNDGLLDELLLKQYDELSNNIE